jgi:hypothetical protein
MAQRKSQEKGSSWFKYVDLTLILTVKFGHSMDQMKAKRRGEAAWLFK